ncbi:MAG: hypothetical protein WC845_03845 [Candidatus Staskawiczbacteria bacterium]|jgi:hypothetical protein
MKNIKTKIILSAIIFLSAISFVGIANATGASLYVSPASITKTAGDTFTVSVGFSASGNKVCAVEGTLVFNNLSCQSITVASDVMAQSSPTCSNPHFLIGIPNCTTLDKTLLTVSIGAGSAGPSSTSVTGVDIIGEGASVGSASTVGNYTITAPVVAEQKEPVTQKVVTQKVEQKEEVAPNNGQVVAQGQEESTPDNLGLASLMGTTKNTNIWLLLLVAIIIGLGYGAFYFFKRFKINITKR